MIKLPFRNDHHTENEVRGIEAAIETMEDVSEFVNSYMADSEYIKNTEKIFEKMTGMERLHGFDFMFKVVQIFKGQGWGKDTSKVSFPLNFPPPCKGREGADTSVGHSLPETMIFTSLSCVYSKLFPHTHCRRVFCKQMKSGESNNLIIQQQCREEK